MIKDIKPADIEKQSFRIISEELAGAGKILDPRYEMIIKRAGIELGIHDEDVGGHVFQERVGLGGDDVDGVVVDDFGGSKNSEEITKKKKLFL